MNEENTAPSQNPGTPIPQQTPSASSAQTPPLSIPNGAPQTTVQNTISQILQDSVTGKPMPATAVKLDPNLVQKPMRTFESDLAEALAKKQGSAAAISIAESKKKNEEGQGIAPEQNVPISQSTPSQNRYMPRPMSPTRETAIPGAVVDIAPNMPKPEPLDSVTATIREMQPRKEPLQETPQFETRPSPQPIAPQTETPPSPVIPPKPRPTPPVQQSYAMEVPKTAEAPRTNGLMSFVKAVTVTVVSLLLIGGGLFAGYVAYTSYEARKPVVNPSPIVIPSLIPHDDQVTLEIGQQQGDSLITRIYAELNKQSIKPGSIFELKLATRNGETTQVVTGSSFIEKLGLTMPGIMLRSLTDRWMLGVYGEETGQKTTFIALTTDFFQNAFAGMLGWEENNMADQLALLLNFKDRAFRPDPTSTTTPSTYFTIRGYYSDKVLRNRDVREFHNAQGELLFLYSFINKETLIITTTESSFIALVDRIEKGAFVR